jgi:tol-pal system protein YbgF
VTSPRSAAGATAVLLATLGAVALAGCASGPFARETGRTDPEVARRLLELEKEATRSRLEIEHLRRRLAALEAPSPEPARPAAPPVPAPEPPPRAVSPPPPPAIVSAIEEAELEPELPRAAAPGGAPDEAEAYERALRLLQAGDPEASEAALREFLAAHPDSDLADNAWFWIGESLLVRDQVDAALTAFRTGVERHPEGNKTPDALYKIGLCLERQGDPDRSAEVWQELIRRFPQTVAAERATEALGER